eukprot:SAG22_NODE_224_length_14744_cov_7.467668_7_plen_190_part_00
MIAGENLTSPRTELFVTSDLLIMGDWKLITGTASSASWAGPTYPNASSVNNTLDRYTAHCSGPDVDSDPESTGPCLYNVGNTPGLGDWTEHNDVSADHPDIVNKMLARLEQLRPTIWSNPNGAADYQESCLNSASVFAGYGGFYGPWCEIGPGPPTPPPPPSPGPFAPTALSNCTWMPTTWVSPPSSNW